MKLDQALRADGDACGRLRDLSDVQGRIVL